MRHLAITDAELEELERSVARALEEGEASGLDLLGEGEISLVLRAGGDGQWACKRLPPFASRAAAERYAGTARSYIDQLSSAGVRVIDTDLRPIPGVGGEAVLYCVQPTLSPATLAVELVRDDPEQAPVLLGDIIDTIGSVVDTTLGLDGQLSNWALVDARLTYFDVTTPLCCRDDGSSELDVGVFLASLPWLLRGLVGRFVVPRIIARYHDARSVIRDLASNLLKEGLDDIVPVVAGLAGDRFGPPLTVEEVHRDRRSDKRTWAALQAVRRVDRAWQRHVRRRTYPFLLPAQVSP